MCLGRPHNSNKYMLSGRRLSLSRALSVKGSTNVGFKKIVNAIAQRVGAYGIGRRETYSQQYRFHSESECGQDQILDTKHFDLKLCTAKHQRVLLHTLVDAIATSGDITLVGNRKNVSIFRKNNEGTERFVVDMLDLATFNEDNFYIQSNDVIYVEPLKQKSWGTGATGMQTLLAITAIFSLVTTVLLLTQAFK